MRQGREGARALCQAIAGRVARSDEAIGRARRVRVVRGVHDAIAYFERGELGPEQTLAECEVEAP